MTRQSIAACVWNMQTHARGFGFHGNDLCRNRVSVVVQAIFLNRRFANLAHGVDDEFCIIM